MAKGTGATLKTIRKKQTKARRIVTTAVFDIMLFNIISIGEELFGKTIANELLISVRKRIGSLSTQYEFYPENRFLPTKDKRYRNIILEKHIILYRVKPTVIEVLAIYNSSIKPSAIKKLRSVKP